MTVACVISLLPASTDASETYPREWLSHLSQESFGDLDSFIRRQVTQTILQVFLDPFWQLATFVCTRKPL